MKERIQGLFLQSLFNNLQCFYYKFKINKDLVLHNNITRMRKYTPREHCKSQQVFIEFSY